MSNFQTVSSLNQNGLPTTTTGVPVVSSNISVLNNGPTSSPVVMSSTGSPAVTRLPPEQIIVPVGNLMGASKVVDTTSRLTPATSHSQPQASSPGNMQAAADNGALLDRSRLRDLTKEVDALEQIDDDVEDVLLQVADDFVESVVAASCQLAKHRKSNTLETKDVQLCLERSWNMQIPGFGSEEIRPYKKSLTTEAHKQRMALIRKTLKKY